MKRRACMAVLLAVLAGCTTATTENYERMLDTWIGVSELELVRKWGPPLRTYETAGHKFLVYRSARHVYMPGSPPTYTTQIVGNTAYTTRVGGTPPQRVGFNCQTTFELVDGKVRSWSWQGNDCKATEERQ